MSDAVTSRPAHRRVYTYCDLYHCGGGPDSQWMRQHSVVERGRGEAGTDDECGNGLLYCLRHVRCRQHRMQWSSAGLRPNRRRVARVGSADRRGAQVEGSVIAQDVTVCGSVKGTIRAVRVRLRDGGTVHATFFISRCRSTRTLCLKDCRGELRTQRTCRRRTSTPKLAGRSHAEPDQRKLTFERMTIQPVR